jgi:hypothetical protein
LESTTANDAGAIGALSGVVQKLELQGTHGRFGTGAELHVDNAAQMANGARAALQGANRIGWRSGATLENETRPLIFGRGW